LAKGRIAAQQIVQYLLAWLVGVIFHKDGQPSGPVSRMLKLAWMKLLTGWLAFCAMSSSLPATPLAGWQGLKASAVRQKS